LKSPETHKLGLVSTFTVIVERYKSQVNIDHPEIEHVVVVDDTRKTNFISLANDIHISFENFVSLLTQEKGF
jgi:hypothetical protein